MNIQEFIRSCISCSPKLYLTLNLKTLHVPLHPIPSRLSFAMSGIRSTSQFNTVIRRKGLKLKYSEKRIGGNFQNNFTSRCTKKITFGPLIMTVQF